MRMPSLSQITIVFLSCFSLGLLISTIHTWQRLDATESRLSSLEEENEQLRQEAEQAYLEAKRQEEIALGNKEKVELHVAIQKRTTADALASLKKSANLMIETLKTKKKN